MKKWKKHFMDLLGEVEGRVKGQKRRKRTKDGIEGSEESFKDTKR